MASKKNYSGSHGRDDHHDRDDHDHHGDSGGGITLKGTKNDDVLAGTDRNDKLFGGKGDDKLFGLAGNDKLDGGKGNDTLDGGAGNDKVFGGRGDDIALYSMAGNLGANFADIGTHDVYDGGSGFDTLRLALTYGEFQLASVQEDIAAFQAFLADKADPRSDHGKTFHFQSFDLDARNFEALGYDLVNTAPTAHGDAAATNEDTSLVIAAPGLLSNDSDPDHLDVLAVTGADAASALGAVVLVDTNGSLSYDPSAALALQQLAEGTTTTDTFSYTIADLAGATSTATVQVTVTGVNDKPVAAADSKAGDEDHAVIGNVLANDTDVDIGDTLHVSAVNGSSAAVGSTIALASGALLTMSADGSYSYDPNGKFEYLAVDKSATDSFTYVAADNHGATSNAVTVELTINGVNDAPAAVDDVVAPTGGGGQTVSLITFEGVNFPTPPTIADGYSFAGFFTFQGAGVGGTNVAAVGTQANSASTDGADGAVARADGQDFSALSLEVASNFGAFSLIILGFHDGSQVADFDDPIAVNPRGQGFTTVDFDANWSSIDELRFYADVDNDFILLDNLQVATGSTGGRIGVSEDKPINIDVLANDKDVDLGDVLHVSDFSATSKMGAAITLNADGTLHYDPTSAADIQALAQGETATDTFSYTASDGHGGTDVASVSVALFGVDEAVQPFTGSLLAPDVDLL